MALAKKPAAKAQEPETQEPQTQAQEPETQEPQTQAQEPETQEPQAQASGLAKFQMERGAYLVQPSTGIRISLKEVRELKDDSWAELQVGAGLLKRVK
jgi:hypothetical protein